MASKINTAYLQQEQNNVTVKITFRTDFKSVCILDRVLTDRNEICYLRIP